VGCVLYEEKIPIAEESRQAAFKFHLDPTACALSGGEDYELLFTVNQDDYDKLKELTDVTVIGYITDTEAGQHIITKGGSKHPITAQGWNAFKGS
jgi:thiamine-monophosphate kinase